PGQRVVDLLLGEQVGPRLADRREARVGQLGGLIDRLGALQFAARAHDVTLAAPLCRFRLHQIPFAFSDFYLTHYLALFHPVADVALDFSYVPADLRVPIDLLKGAELRRERQPLGQVFPFDPGYRDHDRFVRHGFRVGLAALLDRFRPRHSRTRGEG